MLPGFLSGRYFFDCGGRVPVRWSIVQVASFVMEPLLDDTGPKIHMWTRGGGDLSGKRRRAWPWLLSGCILLVSMEQL